MSRAMTILAAAGLMLILPVAAPAQPYGEPYPPSYGYNPMDPFYQFAGQYPSTAAELRGNPELLSNQSYLQTHPEVLQFLNANPAFAQQLYRNPHMLRQGPYANKYWNHFYKKYRKQYKHHKDWDWNHGHHHGHDHDHDSY